MQTKSSKEESVAEETTAVGESSDGQSDSREDICAADIVGAEIPKLSRSVEVVDIPQQQIKTTQGRF